jgi:sterol desaturase/sphingolipid hydroxylase (fatty acid hydroxylase superfamily)
MRSILAFALPVVIVIATLEGLLLALVMRRNSNWRAYFASLADALGRQYVIVTLFSLSLAAPAWDFAHSHRLFTIPIVTAVAVAALLTGQDFCYYWFHRCAIGSGAFGRRMRSIIPRMTSTSLHPTALGGPAG